MSEVPLQGYVGSSERGRGLREGPRGEVMVAMLDSIRDECALSSRGK